MSTPASRKGVVSKISARKIATNSPIAAPSYQHIAPAKEQRLYRRGKGPLVSEEAFGRSRPERQAAEIKRGDRAPAELDPDPPADERADDADDDREDDTDEPARAGVLTWHEQLGDRARD
jgi:hypothetical protein